MGVISMRLKDHIAVVTGAGQGIGRQIALRLAKEGAKVILADINEQGLQETDLAISRKYGSESLIALTNVTSEESVAFMVRSARERFGRLDILVNNSGIAGPTKGVEDVALEEWENVMAVNLRGVFLSCKHAVPVMKAQKGGCIVNISSVTGKRALVRRAPYAASKMAVIGLTRTLAAELGEYGIRVNAICPGTISGSRQQTIVEAAAKFTGKTVEQIMTEKAAASPLRTLVDPEYVAAMVAFLCSSDAAVITGQDINVSAGSVMY
jgi:NAD(P)-dependent dehydrogenase (short-subunit alcohol dehydrogenase family)